MPLRLSWYQCQRRCVNIQGNLEISRCLLSVRPQTGRASFSVSSFKQDVPQQKPTSSSSTSTSPDSSDIFKSDSAKANSHYFVQEQEQPHYDVEDYASMPKNFGTNQYMEINEELRGRLRQVLWQFKAPIRYAVAYGSGVFSQGKSHLNDKPMIDLLLGVTYTQHWHSLNLSEHRKHYSLLGSLGSGVISLVQDQIGAGVYFNPYVEMNGMMIKYGVVNLDTLCRDLTEWDTLYLAGRMHKPVKILRDESRVRVANQANLLSAVRVALLMLPENFTEQEMYTTIAGISYTGDPRMNFAEHPDKVKNIVANQLPNFRRLYAPLIDTLPNIAFKSGGPGKAVPQETILLQDMDPIRRGNMIRRLPKAFRGKLYFQYQKKFAIPRRDFLNLVGTTEEEDRVKGKKGGEFEQRIAKDYTGMRHEVIESINRTISWPSTSQSIKGILTSGILKSWKYVSAKMQKFKKGKTANAGENKDTKAS